MNTDTIPSHPGQVLPSTLNRRAAKKTLGRQSRTGSKGKEKHELTRRLFQLLKLLLTMNARGRKSLSVWQITRTDAPGRGLYDELLHALGTFKTRDNFSPDTTYFVAITY